VNRQQPTYAKQMQIKTDAQPLISGRNQMEQKTADAISENNQSFAQSERSEKMPDSQYPKRHQKEVPLRLIRFCPNSKDSKCPVL